MPDSALTGGRVSLDNDQPTDNAKDFLEHLRTVHFTLLVLCLGLLVVTFSPAPRSISEAKKQIGQIAEATSDSNWTMEWSEDWTGKMVLDATKDMNWDLLCGHVPFHLNPIQVAGRTYAVDFFGQNVILKGAPQYSPEVHVATTDRVALRLNRPTNLAQFKEIYDSQVELYCPAALKPEVWFKDNDAEIQKVPLKRGSPNVEAEHIKVSLDSSPPYKVDPMVVTFSGRDSKWRKLIFPVQKNAVTPLTSSLGFRNHLIAATRFKDWGRTNYKDAFPELYSLTHEFFEDDDFNHVKQLIEVHEKYSKELFEAFGVKFPVEATARWGIFLVVGVQIYLFLHLKEYRHRKFPPGNIAWIGAYRFWSARFVFGATAWVLPTIVIGAVIVQRGLSLSPTDLILLPVAWLLSLALGILNWRVSLPLPIHRESQAAAAAKAGSQ